MAAAGNGVVYQITLVPYPLILPGILRYRKSGIITYDGVVVGDPQRRCTTLGITTCRVCVLHGIRFLCTKSCV